MLPKIDLHLHTKYSDGTGTPEAMIEAAEARGLEAVAITDHGPELNVGIKREKISQMLEDVKLAKEGAKLRVFVSFEANVVNEYGDLDIESPFIQQLDILVAGIHYTDKVLGPEELAREYFRRATRALEKSRIDIFAHPLFLHRSLLPYLPREDIESFVRLAADRGVAMEVNEKYRAPEANFLSLCLREGVKLSVGSDAHNPEEVGKIDWAMSTLRKVGAKREDLILEIPSKRAR